MPQRPLPRLSSAVRSSFHKIGLDIRRARPTTEDFPRLAHFLKTRGVATVLDVGANRGQFAKDLIAQDFGGKIISFEPLPDLHAQLEREAELTGGRWRIGPRLALSDRKGVQTFNVSLNLSSSSLLPVLAPSVDAAPESATTRQIQVDTDTLDAVLPQLQPASPIFLKIDTQGAESQVLSGAAGALRQIVGVKLELSLQRLYEGQELAHVLNGRLIDAGFDCWDLVPGFRNRETGQLLQYDGIYFPPGLTRPIPPCGGGSRHAPQVVVLEGAGLDGHRRDYAELFQRILQEAGAQVVFQPIKLHHVTSPAVLLSLMIEDHAFAFLALALARALLGRRSVGLLFMPHVCARPRGLARRAKRILLRLLRRLDQVHVLTILPFSIEPGMAEIASGWIYDPQLWDWAQGHDAAGASSALSCDLLQHAAGRSIVVSLGRQNMTKGFGLFADLANRPGAAERHLFVAAGPLDMELASRAQAFERAGGVVIDRRLADEEMASLYQVASWVWACYSPDYDQSSGVFGRAVQTGRAALVRQGSRLERLAKAIGQPVGALAWDDRAGKTAPQADLPAPAAGHSVDIGALMAASLSNLSEALGFQVRRVPDAGAAAEDTLERQEYV